MNYKNRPFRRFRKTIGKNIHSLRIKRGVLLHDLAADARISPTRLDRYEIGKGTMSLADVFHIARALGTDTAVLIKQFPSLP